MSEIIVPVDYSNVSNVIPPGEDIIYSSIAKASTTYIKTTIFWETHILFTSNGIAFSRPENWNKPKKSDVLNVYYSWHKVSGMSMVRMLGGAGFGVDKINMNIIGPKDDLPKDQRKERAEAFIAKYRPLLIEKKVKYLNELQQDPKKNKKQIKTQQKELIKLRKLEEKRLK